MIVPQWVIEKKRDGGALSADEIAGFIEGFTRGEIPDYQAAAWAMAVFFRGMSADETAVLTDAMLRSGGRLNLRDLDGPRVDKHSTGGVGDATSLILAPLLAACGAYVPMLSGRGLGITGGTLDKLESIPGFKVDLSDAQAAAVLRRVGCVMIGPSPAIAPADRKLYALRDVTGTVPSVPLIVASILCKKLAEDIEHLVLDVKWGRGAFMTSLPAARDLAAALVATAGRLGLPARALITDMNQPLGSAAGNALEVRLCLRILRGDAAGALADLTVELAAELLDACRLAKTLEEGRRMARERLTSGRALERFANMIAAQGGDASVIENPDRLPSARWRQPMVSPTTAWVGAVDAERIGRAALIAGAGRRRADEAIDPAAGVADIVRIGARVNKGDVLAVIHSNDEARAEEARRWLSGAFVFSDGPVDPPPLVAERLA